MKVRITSDGTYHGSRIENAETGEPIEKIASVDIHIGWKTMSATLYTEVPIADITCDATLVPATTPLICDPDNIDAIDNMLALLTARRQELTRRA